MRKEVSITKEESESVERLFLTYNSYMSMLEYFSNSDSPMYDKKWNEASEIWIKLDKKKREIEVKYKPVGEWDRYEFDFNKQTVVFIRDED